MPVPDDKEVFNSSDLVRLLSLDKSSHDMFKKEFNLSGNPSVSAVYCLIRKDGIVSPPVEIAFSRRFMNGEVGPQIGFAHGCALPVPQDSVKDLTDYLSGKYAGELAVEFDARKKPCKVSFGHMPHYMCMYAEFFSMKIDILLDWLTEGIDELPEMRKGVAICNAVSSPPFPSPLPNEAVKASPGGERHIWRVVIGDKNLALVTAHSDKIPSADSHHSPFAQCRKRLYRTINELRKYNDFIQYRTDAAYSLKFAFAQGGYEECQVGYQAHPST